MLFRIAVLSALFLEATASTIFPTGDIPADSKAGNSLLSKARRLNDDEEDDFTWVASMSIKFNKCHSVLQFGDNENGGDEGGRTYTQNLVQFRLCPTSGSCSNSCSGGADYVIEMVDFADAYTESKMEAMEYNCEVVRENCYCDDANDDEVCESQCYAAAGLNYCEDEDLDLQRYLECQEMELAEEDDDAGQRQYMDGYQNYAANVYAYENNEDYNLYVGPYCSSDGSKIYIGVFEDEICGNLAESGTYEQYHFGESLPFSKESIVGNDCVSCKEPVDEEDQNDNDQEDEDEVIEMCENLYEASGKCEANLESALYPNTEACTFIHSTLPKLDTVYKTQGSKASTSTILAWVFLVSTVGLGAVAFYFRSKAQRSSVNLSEQGNGVGV